MATVNQSTVPWRTMILRNAFGVAGVVHQPAGGFLFRYAWPSARRGSPLLEGGIEAAYRAEIEERLQRLRNPFRTAEVFWVEEISDPRRTRRLLCEFADVAEKLLEPGMARFPLRP